MMQRELDITRICLKKWKIEINTQKCNHVTFTITLRKAECPSLYFNGSALPKTDTDTAS